MIPSSNNFYSRYAYNYANTCNKTFIEFVRDLGPISIDSDYVDLSHRNLTSVPSFDGNLSQLKTLRLDHNQLKTIPECLFRFPPNCVIHIGMNPIPQHELNALQARINTPGYMGPRFDISNQKIETKKPSDVAIDSYFLDLSNKNLDAVPAYVTNLKQLESLFLDHNLLTTLPENIGSLSKLDQLRLGFNRLTSLPSTIGNLALLQDLTLSHNELNSLPENLGNLTRLLELNLDHNRFTTIPSCLFGLSRECLINITNNLIPPSEIEALQARIDAPGYNGPRFIF